MKQVVLKQTNPLYAEFKLEFQCDMCGEFISEHDCYQESQDVVCLECAHKAQEVESGKRD